VKPVMSMGPGLTQFDHLWYHNLDSQTCVFG
jgi:hypothetical protein